MPLHFVTDEAASAQPGDAVVLTGAEAHHAASVRRVRVDEAVTLGDGRGVWLDGTVSAAGPKQVEVVVTARDDRPAPSPRFVLVQALAKGDRDELAVQAATELGVDAIVPWQASRCVTQWVGARAAKSLDKWRRTAREAAKQSRRPHVPKLAPLMSTAEVTALLAETSALVLHESADEPLATCALPDVDEFVLVVGPEGGIAEDELAAFASVGARTVRLGSPVLSTSTAGVAALAALSVRLGRWS